MFIEDIAKVVHETNRAYCLAFGDTSHGPWEELSDAIKRSVIDGVKFHLAVEHGPEASHENWMKGKLRDGWVYGEEKDEEKKTHPCLIPFNELSEVDQGKDYVFKTVVEQLKPYLVGKPR